MAHEINKARVRESLQPRREPYWGAPLARGLYLGIRKIHSAKLNAHLYSWVARLRTDSARHLYRSLGYLGDAFGFDEARRAAIDWHKGNAAGVTGRAETIEGACKRYVVERRKEKGEATARDAEARFERTVYGTEFGRVRLDKIRASDVKAWRDGLVLSRAAANRTMTSLKAALNLAVRERAVTGDRQVEWSSVSRFKDAGSRRTLFLDLKQRRRLLRAAGIGPFRDLVEAAITTGARPGELVTLRRDDFDERTESATFSGKTGARTVPLSPAAVALFSRLSKRRPGGTDLLLVRPDGRPWGHSDWDELVRDAAARAKLPGETVLYTLRHSFITQALQDGMTTLDVARLVGTSLAMIEKHYGHLVAGAASARLKKISLI